ncbi:DUF262 domain-containing protein [Phytohabitans suffuscus]|nr:DUF262 domain-containing protein [Phytohabitans suffuscus]
MSTSPRLEVWSLADLVRLVTGGRIRVPAFHRPFVWNVDQTVAVFDSIARGLPIGAITILRKPAPAERVRIGPVEVEAEADDEAIWLIDGQQRLAALVGGLTAPGEVDDERFRIFYDLDEGIFRSVPLGAQLESSWMPASKLLDTRARLAWYQQSGHATSESNQSLEAGEAMTLPFREYRLPVYEFEGNEPPAAEVFVRLNTLGTRLSAEDVRQAQRPASRSQRRTTLQAVSRSVISTGFGKINEPTLRDYLGIIGLASNDLADLDRLILDAIRFLRSEAAVPHLITLPDSGALPAVALFVRRYGYPSGRIAELLRRWLWRHFATGVTRFHLPSKRTRAQMPNLVREALADDPYDTVATLLSQTPETRLVVNESVIEHDSAVGLLAMLSAGPLNLDTGLPEKPTMLFKQNRSSLLPIFPGRRHIDLPNMIMTTATPTRPAASVLSEAAEDVLASHLVDRSTLDALSELQESLFFRLRGQRIMSAAQDLIDFHAEWGSHGGEPWRT